MSKAISRRNFLMATGAVGAAGLLAACGSKPAASSTASSAASQAPAASADESLALSDGPVNLSISWWGGDSRHAAYQSALEAFQAEHSNITVEPTFAAWSGWEEKQSTALAADQGSDVMEVNWNWLYQYSPTGEKFVDLREYSDIIDLSQWSDAAKNACTVADSLQAVPISMTGRIFYWNMNTFKQAGIEAVPTSYDDLIAAGKSIDGPIASFASGYNLFTASASTCEAVWRSAASPSLSFAVKIFKEQSSSTIVLKSTTSPLISPAQATLASPSLISNAISYTDLLSAYSFTEPSFNVIFIIFLLLPLLYYYFVNLLILLQTYCGIRLNLFSMKSVSPFLSKSSVL